MSVLSSRLNELESRVRTLLAAKAEQAKQLTQARAELERANAKLEVVRGAAKRWLGIADQRDRPDAPRVNLRDLPPSAGPLMNQTAAGCWRGLRRRDAGHPGEAMTCDPRSDRWGREKR